MRRRAGGLRSVHEVFQVRSHRRGSIQAIRRASVSSFSSSFAAASAPSLGWDRCFRAASRVRPRSRRRRAADRLSGGPTTLGRLRAGARNCATVLGRVLRPTARRLAARRATRARGRVRRRGSVAGRNARRADTRGERSLRATRRRCPARSVHGGVRTASAKSSALRRQRPRDATRRLARSPISVRRTPARGRPRTVDRPPRRTG